MNEYSWIKIYRKLEQWEWFTDSKTLHVFLLLLIRANIKDSRWNGKVVKRGQLISSYQKIAAATGLSVSSARRAIDNLVSTGEIICEPSNKYNLITVVKYETYQAQYAEYFDFEQTEEQTEEQASEQPAEQHNKKIKKNSKNEKNKLKNEKRTEITTKEIKQSGRTGQKTEKDDTGNRASKYSTLNSKTDVQADTKYIPRYFELDLHLPKQYYGKFNTEEEWWDYVEQHRKEVESAYEL